ncbi:hypothetical protein NP945_00805 [Mesorhizobium sp. LMG17149]|jgi:hypothetical protein|uniref:hypothetical protein n=1 Tax=Mesorhizobium sp. LMG17149 TaxID=2968497 RepID=UPI002118E693|nr:hypothetical protein [Mesorhizobium sp. LMG17149]MCQ8870361.1 hypothetical protein [Mesorhizobium sp. LMG17149]
MKILVKISGGLLDRVREDLQRPHHFAHERVGFLTAGVAACRDGLLLLIRGYLPVDDGDYEPSRAVGARIGSNAMRKAVQAAYRPQSSLLHVHTHGGRGVPRFSGVDLESAKDFVPAFFQTVAKMPHGLLVLSDDAAAGNLWLDHSKSVPINRFFRVGRSLTDQWRSDYELA